jgi:hypothetical protein
MNGQRVRRAIVAGGIIAAGMAGWGVTSAQGPQPQTQVQVDRQAVPRAAQQVGQAKLSPRIIARAAERAQLASSLSQGQCQPPAQLMKFGATIDTSPLARPVPIKIIKGDRDDVLNRIATLLRDQRFTETQRDPDQAVLLATRADTAAPNARDDVLVWVDGQAGDASRVRIYFDYGRYEPFFMGKVQRVQMTTQDQQERVGAVRTAILNLDAGSH